ncbi:MAG TPA: peptidylprolyl isomerase [Bauldia sp.]|nr:peptidylprolyl isomerase [Bauldia sp.]
MNRLFVALAVVFLAVLPAAHAAAPALDPENTLYMDLPKGRVVIELLPNIAPHTVDQIKKLTRAGFYNGTPFHRVIPGFMAQGGDPTGTGTGGSQLPNLKAEFSNAHFTRGTLGMARSDDPDSANSQFFICFQDCGDLDGQYTVFGQVVSGMEFVDALKPGDPNVDDGQVPTPDKLVKMQVAADAQ